MCVCVGGGAGAGDTKHILSSINPLTLGRELHSFHNQLTSKEQCIVISHDCVIGRLQRKMK